MDCLNIFYYLRYDSPNNRSIAIAIALVYLKWWYFIVIDSIQFKIIERKKNKKPYRTQNQLCDIAFGSTKYKNKN